MERKSITFNAELSPPVYGLPPSMQRIIREVAVKRQTAVDFAVAPALGAASIAIGSRVTFQANGYENMLNIWIMMIGRSTSNKSVPMKDIYAPLYRINKSLYDNYKSKVETVVAERANGSDKRMPKTSQILIEDSTPEARNQALEDNPHGLLNSREELTATIGDIGRYGKSGELSALLSLRDGTSLSSNRKGEGLKYIERPFYSWVSGIQPGMLKPTFDNPKFATMGFLNRFIVMYPSDMPRRVPRENISDVTVDAAVVEEWIKLVNRTYHNLSPCVITATDEAMRVYRRFLSMTFQADESTEDEYEASVWGKLRIYALQLSGIACVMNAMERGEQPVKVNASEMSWAVDMAFYSHCCQMRMMRQIYEGYQSTAQSLSKKDVIKALPAFFGDINKSKLADVLGVDVRQIRRWMNG